MTLAGLPPWVLEGAVDVLADGAPAQDALQRRALEHGTAQAQDMQQRYIRLGGTRNLLPGLGLQLPAMASPMAPPKTAAARRMSALYAMSKRAAGVWGGDGFVGHDRWMDVETRPAGDNERTPDPGTLPPVTAEADSNSYDRERAWTTMYRHMTEFDHDGAPKMAQTRSRVELLAFDARGRILTGQREGRLVLPGGGTDGESPTVAAQREAKEEAGVDVDRVRDVGVAPRRLPVGEKMERGHTHEQTAWRVADVASRGAATGDDKLPGLGFVDPQALMAQLRRRAEDPENPWRAHDKERMLALSAAMRVKRGGFSEPFAGQGAVPGTGKTAPHWLTESTSDRDLVRHHDPGVTVDRALRESAPLPVSGHGLAVSDDSGRRMP